jgi:hypothetical protein
MIRERQGFTVITDLRADASTLAALRRTLAEIRRDPADNPHVPFARVGGVHFASFVIVDNDPAHAPMLVFDVAHDGPRAAMIDQLLAVCRAGLEAIFAAADGFDRATDLRAFLISHIRRSGGAHVGYPGRSLRGLENDRRVADFLRAQLTGPDAAALRRLEPVPLRRELARRLRAAKARDPSLTTAPTETSALRTLAAKAPLAVVGIPAVLLVIALLPLTRVREWLDRREQYTPPPRPPERADDVREDELMQNQLTHVVELRGTWVRRWSLRYTLFVIDLLSRLEFDKGNLGGIPTIHFARWIIVPGARRRRARLLFLSNYDLSWESYLSDFIERAAKGLTAVWSHTRGFPPARWLLWDGATHEQSFKTWARQHQVPAQAWYCARPGTSVAQTLALIAAREGVEQDGERAASAWLGDLV